jgi:alcohol dehydrogenase (cytochrome c)
MDDTGSQQPTPLVYDGIMYLPNPRGVIQALDAATGDLIWEYRPARAASAEASGDGGRGSQRNIAIFGDKIFGTTSDAHIIAVDARTGKLVWDTTVADSKLGYAYTSGPIVVRGKVMAGMTGCTRYKKDVCFISAHDAATGKEVWRTSTIARPGEPGGDTWGDLPLEFRAGSDAWIPGSYDPATNLVFWGTAQAKPWARAVRGTDGDALYTNSTLALDPDTGKMKWYYQHIPGETLDMDEVFERILIDAGGRQSVFTMGKLGILWQLDRATGAFIRATDIGYQNIVDVDQSTGKVTYREGKIPKIGVELDFCPSTAGFKSWRAMAFSPQTNVLYIPIHLNCEIGTFGPVQQTLGGGGVGPVRRKNTKHPKSDGNLGEFLALDARSGKTMWRHRTPSPMNTAALTTGGGLVFGGDWDRRMYAYDAVTGKILWQTRLPTSAQGFPITYLAKGKQYVAMPAGTGGGSWTTMIPPELAPEIRRPNSGNALLVFALPGGTRETQTR